MKNVILSILMFAFSTHFMLATEPTERVENKVRTQIIELLESPKIPLSAEETLAKLQFMITNEGKIVVLTVKSENTHVDAYVKQCLNYKKVSTAKTDMGKVFAMDLKIIKP